MNVAFGKLEVTVIEKSYLRFPMLSKALSVRRQTFNIIPPVNRRKFVRKSGGRNINRLFNHELVSFPGASRDSLRCPLGTGSGRPHYSVETGSHRLKRSPINRTGGLDFRRRYSISSIMAPGLGLAR